MNSPWVLAFSYLTVTLVLLLSLDDLIVDLIAWLNRLRPQPLSLDDLEKMRSLTEKKIAIIIANWKEDEIIERMVRGNIDRIEYSNYYFFLGVYPNDTATTKAAQNLKATYPNIFVVNNPENGPTSKGQMLNQIVTYLRAEEIKTKTVFDILLIQDSEDIIHPMALKLINYKMEKNDFLQTPVLSLKTQWNKLTSGTYVDEFAESHTRDMLVRSHLKLSIPSAGVGTAMSRLFVEEMIQLNEYKLFKEDTLTEDYHLGMMAHKLGFDSEFVCCYINISQPPNKWNQKDFIATREYFPSNTAASIRQKTRWTLGISIQGFLNLGWTNSFKENYFLWRDRRSLVNAPVLILSYTLSLSFIIYFALEHKWPEFVTTSSFFQLAFWATFILMINKVLQRIRLVFITYGLPTTLLVPVRWFVANYINCSAALMAVSQFRKSLKTGEKPVWVKTTHELPAAFGQPVDANLLPIEIHLQKPNRHIVENQELQ